MHVKARTWLAISGGRNAIGVKGFGREVEVPFVVMASKVNGPGGKKIRHLGEFKAQTCNGY